MPQNVLEPLLDALSLDDASAALRARNTLTVVDPARAPVIAAFAKTIDEPLLVVTASARDAERVEHELGAWIDKVVGFPAWETLPHERLSPRAETVARRLRALRALRTGEARIMVAPVLAAMQFMVPGSNAIEPVVVGAGAERDPELLVRDLAALDYQRTELVERRGEFAVRGGLLDVFPPDLDHPVRIEFFGDQIESIRTFAVASQRSIERVERVEIYPCRELLATDEVRGRAIAAIERHPTARVELNRLADGITFEGVEALLDTLYDELPVLRDLIPNARVLVLDPKRTEDRSTELLREVEELRAAAWEAAGEGRQSPAGGELATTARALGDDTAAITPFRGDNPVVEASVWDVQRGDVKKMTASIKQLLADGYRVIACAGTDGQAQRVVEVLLEHQIVAPLYEGGPLSSGQAATVVAHVEEGFWSPSLGCATVGENDLFGKRRAHRDPRAQRRRAAIPLDLADGDLVVHVTHGVGRYRGVETRSIGASVNDYIVIEYAEGDKLYVPADAIDAVSKYVGGEAPKLNRLGTGDWARTKSRVRKAVRDMADELMKLYTARAQSRGYGYSSDQPWQAELEDAFPYVETRDQLAAIDDVKSDMERPSPMDRLVTGDVGFGKTEIAIRAAFKAVLDGKQVAVLVPTTLLAQQHFATFTERYAPFPVRVVMLSRFVTAKEQKRIVDDIAAGKADVIIGTHRILQKDIVYADLGLLVVDEEQRFGVAHKERLKQLKTNVDVLTMTATPIPRTLEMALGGIRDMSVIDTPPEDRHPVLTFVGESSDETIARAIRREMLREGQTFYVHNTVQDIDGTAGHVARLVPDARIGIAHGQMEERRLEKVMLDFWDKQFDVLVTTTIIESGLDIPTANTLIVDRAHALGLSQLYQLRGRVGRSRERAYAYFLYPADRSLTEQSHARLTAIGQFTDLGSGLQIALRDLEIRGAGSLLGAEQSGHIATVGFDLYVKLLQEAVEESRGKRPQPKPEVKIDVPLDAHLPEEWIAREGLRLEAYRRVAEAETHEQLEDVRAELRDRYGELPPQAEALFLVAEIKLLVGYRGARTLVMRDGHVRIEPLPLAESEQVRLRRLFKGAIYKAPTFTAVIPLTPGKETAGWLLGALQELFATD